MREEQTAATPDFKDVAGSGKFEQADQGEIECLGCGIVLDVVISKVLPLPFDLGNSWALLFHI